MAVERPTANVSHISKTMTARDLVDFLEQHLGRDSIYACEIFSEYKNWKSRGFGRVQFETLEIKDTAINLSRQHKLLHRGSALVLENSFNDIIIRPVDNRHKLDNGILYAGFMIRNHCMSVLESWDGVKAWIMPDRKKVEFYLEANELCYKLEVQYEDLIDTCTCRVGGEEKLNAFLLKLHRGVRIYQKMSGPGIASRFCIDRYHICKEDVGHLWVRTTDFSSTKSIGHSTCLCWDVDDAVFSSDIISCLPFFSEDILDLTLEDGEDYCTASELAPLVTDEPGSQLDYEVLFQLNSLVHAGKIPLSTADNELITLIKTLSRGTARMVLKKIQQQKSICYDPLSFIRNELHFGKKNDENYRPSVHDHLMNCHRVFVTPTRVYCLGPDLDSCNYVVRTFTSNASDFLRVSFVDEDWSKLPYTAISTTIEQGIFLKPFRTAIYDRILAVLRDGITIGDKKFEFLAFSASQLRSNSIWMFASNEKITAYDIRQWMGSFTKIRSVSKCAARMGQLFSSSVQTLAAPVQDIEIIPDIEVVSDGIGYCFSDGVGKISLEFARQVAQKYGLDRTPSAFQIRYGGYKGVVVVDRNSFMKLSLRKSMLKFESMNLMLNVTKCSDSMPSYLNREIISLLSTLGIEDRVFEKMQSEQVSRLDEMLRDREMALGVLENVGGFECKDFLIKMLSEGYEPDREPYISMMLRAYRENQLLDLSSRCRIFVPKGRVLIGCMDETGILDYGQIFIRVTMTKEELKHSGQIFFQKVDESTSIVIGKVVVTKNPCLHPGDVRVLEAIYEASLEQKGLIDCLVFPQKGRRPHPNECSGGDLDGDLFFVSWDKDIIPKQMVTPMDYIGRKAHVMDHDVTLEEIKKFFVDYMINDTLGAISTAHLVHADREPEKARSSKCLHLATLHSMAVDFAKTGAPAEMPRALKPKEYPDFLERDDKPMYISQGVLGKLYRAIADSRARESATFSWSQGIAEAAYDRDLEVPGFETFIDIALVHKGIYIDKMSYLLGFYGATSEDEILTANLRSRPVYLQRDNRKYAEMKDRITMSVQSLRKEIRAWLESSCRMDEQPMLASAWYHVTYHPAFCQDTCNYLSFPWIAGDLLLPVKSANSRKNNFNRVPTG